MKIQWIVDGVFGSEETGFTSTLASNRYRAIIPAQALRAMGEDVQFVAASRWDVASQTLGKADVVCIGKIAPGGDPRRVAMLSERMLKGAQQATRAGIPVLADFNDDHFERPDVGGYWRALAQVCSLAVVGSSTMKEVVERQTSRPVAVIGDPIGSPPGDPRVFNAASSRSRWWTALRWGSSASRLKLVWYGNLNNWPPLQDWLGSLAKLSNDQPWLLWVVTTPNSRIEAVVKQFNQQHGPRALIELVEWSESEQWSLVNQADVVLIPSDASAQRKTVKTGNRLTDALHAGRYVVASALPAYQPYADVAALCDDPLPPLKAYLANPKQSLDQIAEGRARVIAELSAVEIAAQWRVVAEQALMGRSVVDPLAVIPASDSSEARPIRLNLGCGDKILPGFVNVDFAENWSGKPPDVVADVTKKLPFPDDHADEVHAYHVLEHLYRWMAPDCLREWIRVLKPGGQLILEMPCLDKILVLFEEFKKTGQPLNPRLTLWALYGDPNYRNEPMTHRWCYSVDELKKLMSSVGLVDVRTERPHTHIEVRDMRMVGSKAYVE